MTDLDKAQPKCGCCCHTDGGCHSRYIPQDWCCDIPQFRSDQQNRTSAEGEARDGFWSDPTRPTDVEG